MDQTVEILGKLMDASAMRQRVLANNLANANTPGYLRKDVEFRSTLTEAIAGGIEEIRNAKPNVITDEDADVNMQGNSVSLQKEMAEITENGLLYDFATEMTRYKFGLLKQAITGTK